MFNYHLLLSLIPFLICTFWALFLSVRYRQSHISKKVLFWFMFTAAWLYFGHFIVFNKFFAYIPFTDTVYTFATLSVYPIFYLYIVSLTGKLNMKYIWVLVPAIIIASVIGICYLMMPDDILHEFLKYCHYDKGDAINSTVFALSVWMHRLMKPTILIQVILCVFYGLRRLMSFSRQVNRFYSNTEDKDMSKIRYLLLAFVVTSCLSVFADMVGRAFFVETTLSMVLILLPFSIMLFLVGYTGNMQTFTIDDLMTEIQSVEDSDADRQKSAGQHIQKDMIDQIMMEGKLYLQPDLKISDVAARLNTNRTYIYQALKSGLDDDNLSFPNYVNKFRIDYFIQLVGQRSADSLKSLMYESGFVSEATFYRAFKKQTGMTPKQYESQLRAEQPNPECR